VGQFQLTRCELYAYGRSTLSSRHLELDDPVIVTFIARNRRLCAGFTARLNGFTAKPNRNTGGTADPGGNGWASISALCQQTTHRSSPCRGH
jgi:hypothetical protein